MVLSNAGKAMAVHLVSRVPSYTIAWGGLWLSSGDKIAYEYMKNREPEAGIRAGNSKGG